MEKTVFLWISRYGYAGIFFLLMFGIIGVPVPDEMLLTFSGYLVFKGELGFTATIVSAFLGSICGITFSYIVGRTGGRYLVQRYGHRLEINQEKTGRVHDWVKRVGRWGLLIGYFIPGVRHLTALVAGASRLRYPVFAVFAYTGGLIWSVTFITAGFYLGRGWQEASASVHRGILTAAGAIAAVLLILYILHRRSGRTR